MQMAQMGQFAAAAPGPASRAACCGCRWPLLPPTGPQQSSPAPGSGPWCGAVWWPVKGPGRCRAPWCERALPPSAALGLCVSVVLRAVPGPAAGGGAYVLVFPAAGCSAPAGAGIPRLRILPQSLRSALPRLQSAGATQAARIAPQKWNGSPCGRHKTYAKILRLTYLPDRATMKQRTSGCNGPSDIRANGVVRRIVYIRGCSPGLEVPQYPTVVLPHQNGCLFFQLLRLPIGGAGGTYIAGCGYRAPAGSLPVP